MPLDSLRKALFFRREGGQQHSRSAATARMTHLSAHSPGSWSSSHEDFACLRFYVWTGGDPGFTLTTAGNDAGATAPSDEDAELVVKRVTALKVWEAGVRPGDILETVGNRRVHTMDAEAAIVLVQMSKSPSIIRFCSATSGKRIRFDILHGRQNLGLSLTRDGSHDIPVVTRISSSRHSLGGFSSGPVSSASGFHLGDVLVAVNGMDAVAAGLDPTMDYLAKCPRPVRLTFERVVNDGDRERWLGIQDASDQTKEHRFPLRSAIPNLTEAGMKARATAGLRCREFLRSLVPAGSQSDPPHLQLEPADSHSAASPSFTCSDVHIEWRTDPLGLTLLEDAISGAPVVNRLTGKGSSTNMESLQHGFELYSINGVRTEGRAFKFLCRDLVQLPKPVKLIFRPPLSDDTSEEEDNNSDHSSQSSPLSLSRSICSSSEAELKANGHRSLARQAVQHRHSLRLSFIREQHEYEVLWTTARLGLKLEIPHHTRGQYPIVQKILKESALDLPSDAVGHLLVCVNNWFTSGLSSTQLRTLLQVATKPAVLRFRKRDGPPGFQRTFLSDCSSGLDDGVFNSRNPPFGSLYSILWNEGELGITFGCYEDADQRNALVVYVKRIRPGQAKNSKLVAIGDILRSINGQDFPPKQKLKKTLRTLVDTKHPVTLGFRRLLVERCSDLNTT
ncbi:hypothetical protein PRIC2_003833 [Phytophthora ramorum]